MKRSRLKRSAGKKKKRLTPLDMNIKRGKIVGFHGTWMSGLGHLLIKNLDTGQVESVPCENAPTVRALEGAFGNVISAGHTVDTGAIKGKEIFYSMGDWGVLEGFTPVDQATPELLEAYDKEKKKAGFD